MKHKPEKSKSIAINPKDKPAVVIIKQGLYNSGYKWARNLKEMNIMSEKIDFNRKKEEYQIKMLEIRSRILEKKKFTRQLYCKNEH